MTQKPDEDSKMEVDGKAVCRGQLEARKKEITKDTRKCVNNMHEAIKNVQKEKVAERAGAD